MSTNSKAIFMTLTFDIDFFPGRLILAKLAVNLSLSLAVITGLTVFNLSLSLAVRTGLTVTVFQPIPVLEIALGMISCQILAFSA